jgi:cytochrome d ubiquinol oxidase subunit II
MEALSFPALCNIWFLLIGVLLMGYAVLDGFDLGVGILHPFVARNDQERRLTMNAIGPIWDGNEVWLVVFGGALFAMFPQVYAAIFSGFYNVMMLLLFGLIFRALAFDFRSKVESRWWKHVWDFGFFGGSTLATFIFGVAVGNLVRGVRLDASEIFVDGFVSQLNPFSLLVGLLSLALFAMHGAIFLYLKTEGEFQYRIERSIWRTFGLFLITFVLATMFALAASPHVLRNFEAHPALWVIPVLNVFAIANIPRMVYKQQPAMAFLSSCASIFGLVLLLGTALYPYMVYDADQPANSLSIFEAASSAATLRLGLIFVLIGMPFVLIYTTLVYRTFHGKVRLGKHSY